MTHKLPLTEGKMKGKINRNNSNSCRVLQASQVTGTAQRALPILIHFILFKNF